MTNPTKTNPDTSISPVSPDSGHVGEKNTRSEARGGVFSSPVDPQHPPRPKRPRWPLFLAALVVVSLGRAAWPVIDVSAVAQLVETVRIVTDQLDQVTDARRALMGEIAALTGRWSDLTGDPFELNTVLDDTDITGSTGLPSAADIREAYDGAPADVVTQVLAAHRAAADRWTAQRGAWNDTLGVIDDASDFLEAIEDTASNQNSETTQGLAAQLDRQIAVSSVARDIAAQQLQLALSGEYRAARLERLQAVEKARIEQQTLDVRSEINDTIDTLQAGFDADTFDRDLYAPVLPRYQP